MLDAIDICALHQRRITDDVLEVSRLHAGRYTLEDREFWLDQVVDAAVTMFAAEAASADIQLLWSDASRERTHARVRADQQRISQIVVNLISNAVKFTSRAAVRTIVVDADLRAAAATSTLTSAMAVNPGNPGSAGSNAAAGSVGTAAAATILFSVRDSGIGMTAEEQGRLFVPFGQASSKTHSNYGGSGMGLFIVKELLDLMGGSIRLESAPGQGSTFFVEIPCTLAAQVGAGLVAVTQVEAGFVGAGLGVGSGLVGAGPGAGGLSPRSASPALTVDAHAPLRILGALVAMGRAKARGRLTDRRWAGRRVVARCTHPPLILPCSP